MATSYSPDLVRCVREYLDSKGFQSQFHHPDGVFVFSIKVESRLKAVTVYIDVGSEGFTVISMPYTPVPVSGAAVRRVSVYFSSINAVLSEGKFEINPPDNEMVFSLPLYCGDKLPTVEYVKAIVEHAIRIWSKYGDAVMDVVFKQSM